MTMIESTKMQKLVLSNRVPKTIGEWYIKHHTEEMAQTVEAVVQRFSGSLTNNGENNDG